ncbi:MAG: methionine adenosyltransferase [Clostridia bacterium]|nr:methionine adenosyltransferase [Clostridia bacterium]
MKIFTSESVTEGHPDKICDSIADNILDAVIAGDPMSRVACEVTAATGLVQIMGEITTTAVVDYADIARRTILGIGYNSSELGFDGSTCCVNNCLHQQSPDIAMGVDADGAGDQGMVFGYASNEVTDNDEYMPAPIAYAHRLSKRLTYVRKQGILKYLRPDGKSQVSVKYDENGRPCGISAIVVSSQHSEDISTAELRRDIEEHVIRAVIPEKLIGSDTAFYINPTGRFVIGGPYGDSGLTGRKIIVDTYGGMGRHGGGAFSGKDPTKVDRSGAYMARYIAKNIVAAGLAEKAELQVAYAIGVAHPVSISIETFGTEAVPVSRIEQAVLDNFDLSPKAIISYLDLRRPIYALSTCYGHFGKTDCNLPWEKLDKVNILKTYI